MARLSGNLRRIFTRNRENRLTDQPIDLTSFIGFLRQQATWIKQHAEYDWDMGHNFSSDNKLLVRFDIGQYIGNFNDYFKGKGLYRHKIEDLFFIMMNILAPPNEIAAILSKENRKKLFAGLLVNLSLNTSIKLADLIKTYYGMINAVSEPINNQTKDSLLEAYKESIELVDKYYVDAVGKQKAAAQSAAPDAAEMLTELLKAFSIHNRADLIAALTKGNKLGFAFSMLVYSILIILLLLYRIWSNLATGKPDIPDIPIIINALLALVIIVMVTTIVAFVKNRTRKRYLLRTLQSLIRHFRFSYSVLDTYFRGRFSFDIRKVL
jgi:hypothetical protein